MFFYTIPKRMNKKPMSCTRTVVVVEKKGTGTNEDIRLFGQAPGWFGSVFVMVAVDVYWCYGYYYYNTAAIIYN